VRDGRAARGGRAWRCAPQRTAAPPCDGWGPAPGARPAGPFTPAYAPPPPPPGRALESRAKVQAASDLKALAHLIPATARLQLDPGAAPGAAAAAAGGGGGAPAVEYILVSTRSVRKGDVVRVLPGEARVDPGLGGQGPEGPPAPAAGASKAPARRRSRRRAGLVATLSQAASARSRRPRRRLPPPSQGALGPGARRRAPLAVLRGGSLVEETHFGRSMLWPLTNTLPANRAAPARRARAGGRGGPGRPRGAG
jgi:hypothetical protein